MLVSQGLLVLSQEASKHWAWRSQRGHLPSEALTKGADLVEEAFPKDRFWKPPHGPEGHLTCLPVSSQLTCKQAQVCAMWHYLPKLTAHSLNEKLSLPFVDHLLCTIRDTRLSTCMISQCLDFCRQDVIISVLQRRKLSSVICPASHRKEQSWGLNQVCITPHLQDCFSILPPWVGSPHSSIKLIPPCDGPYCS